MIYSYGWYDVKGRCVKKGNYKIILTIILYEEIQFKAYFLDSSMIEPADNYRKQIDHSWIINDELTSKIITESNKADLRSVIRIVI